MADTCDLITTEYQQQFVKKKIDPPKAILPRDKFSERIEEGQIDPRFASIPQKLDEAAEELIRKRIQDIQRTVNQVVYTDPWKRIRKESTDSSDALNEALQSELLSYINNLYYNPHNEKVLAPPATTKRILGYIRPKLLHGDVTVYQDCHGRTGGECMLRNHKRSTK